MTSSFSDSHTFVPLRTQTPTLELRDALRRGDISSRELVELSLDLSAREQSLGAFVSVQAESALREAERADQILQSANPFEGAHLPPLLGIPTAHKDLVEVAGVVTTRGSRAVAHVPESADGAVAAAVRSAGAVCLGKTQVPEFGIAAYSENLIADPARNPGDRARTPGGSTGGTATAIAAGLISGAIGSDGGGSLRIPAAACGLIGLKPTRGSVPSDAGNSARSRYGTPPLTVSGPLTQTVTDAALWFDALRADHKESTLAAMTQSESLSGLRIGISSASPFSDAVDIRFSPATLVALQLAADLLATQHRVEAPTFQYLPEYAEAFTSVWSQPLAGYAEIPAQRAQLGSLARWFAEQASQRSPEQHAAAADTLQRCAQQARMLWSEYDIIMTPTIAFVPPKIRAFTSLSPQDDYRLQCQWAPITSLVNVVGAPAISVPVAHTRHAWPISVQLIGRPHTESQLLQLAQVLHATAHDHILEEAYE